ncbi:MAG: hypothetical protein GC195_11050 [Nostoc sp. RI_552]|nr:hypothetical protein [Nostoc sp. RI_552]
MFNFPTLSLQQPQLQQPANLLQLVNNFRNYQQLSHLQNLREAEIDSWRSLDDIIQTLQEGNSDQIKRIEWVYCLYNKAEWDQEHPESSQETSELIWTVAMNNLWLKQSLLWLLVLHYSQSSSIISDSLVKTFVSFVKQGGKNDIQIVIIETIRQNNYQQLALVAKENNLTPKELLKNANFPSSIPGVSQALNYVVTIFVNDNQPQWLLRCFQQMSREQQHQQVNKLLTTVNAETGSCFLSIVEWLRQNYGPRTINSQWRELSSQAQSALRQWIGAATWGDFDKLLTALIRHLESRLQLLSPGSREYQEVKYQKNQLDRRKGFWSNYSDRFERLRILVPKSTSWISDELTRDIDILVDDGSNETEVCIFDFGDWFIVEFFRGNGSEILLFNRDRSTRFEEKLFQSQNLSISDIRRLRRLGGEIHDHVYLWQYYAEQWLRGQHGIYPNDGIISFQGLDHPFNIYSRITGLPVPSVDKQSDRERALVHWRRDIERIY